MRIHAGVAVLVALTLTSCAGGKFKPLSPEPMVWVSESSHDFGTIPDTQPVNYIFSVKNTGGKPLNISRVQTSCGCTAAVLDHQFLQPGEATRLKVQFDPRGRRGKQSRSLWIHSNDPKSPRKQLNISATIESGGGKTPPRPTVTSQPKPAPAKPQASPPPESLKKP